MISTEAAAAGRTGRIAFALGLLALGILSVYSGDFAYQWQPVPAELPARELLARMTGLLCAGVGLALLLPATASIAALGTAAIFWIWLLLLHVPTLLTSGDNWLGAAELLALASGGWTAMAMFSSRSAAVLPEWLIAPRALTIARLGFAISLPVFGLSHFVYAEPAAGLLPEWMPGRLFWTYFTGVAHVAAGLSLLSGILSRIAARLLCLMFACFVLLLHIPRVVAAPGSRYEWTMLLMSVLLNGAAWMIAASVLETKSGAAPVKETQAHATA